MNGNFQHNPDEAYKALQHLLAELGMAEDFLATCPMPLHPECSNLVDTEFDVFGRQPRLDAEAFTAWSAMRTAARDAGITLQIVSAFRSITYQQQLFLRKLARGDRIDDILKVNAAPGFSEHHSGCAVDIGCPEYSHLEEEFEQSAAFAWLRGNASRFGFYLTFDRNNPWGVQYEPWHWCYKK